MAAGKARIFFKKSIFSVQRALNARFGVEKTCLYRENMTVHKTFTFETKKMMSNREKGFEIETDL